ncbi:aldehyde dehydrogenase (NADP(+)) [Pandoraea sp. NPDC087047]|uniref:aldehyde dehydrogenase (NADP(+)) n=1 Tax=Pandoraea sp. NPDC087047 TaxID=3364390 RepID=UPI00381730D9
MKITGNLFIGAHEVWANAGTMKALNPATNEEIEPSFAFGGREEVDRAAMLADEAFDSYNATSLPRRAEFLERIATGLEAIAPALAERISLETGLPATQLEGEAIKSAEQFRQFAAVVRQGRFRQATIDPALPDRQPRPRMDHRMQKIGLGPIAIFGASNFPISYSVAGGDTASALAAGCPVIVKAHNAHPGGSELMARVIQQAVADSGLHEGVFSMVRGGGNAVGETLIDHPLVKGVAFTGSEVGGMALYRRAQQRPDPIPVFTEMTSVNPTFVLPAALAARGASIGDGFGERMLVNVGQACLKPAILLAVAGIGYDALREALIARVAAMHARPMLTPGIWKSYTQNLSDREGAGAQRIAQGGAAQGVWDGQSALLEVDGTQMLESPSLFEEVFGPAALLVRVKDVAQFVALAKQFRGQLSATMQIDEDDFELASCLLPTLERRTGRIVINAFAHPQEVSYASIHGGPFPATSDSRFTSVGMTSIERFLRPVCYQGFPDALLPEALKHGNPRALWRLTFGELSKA